MKSLAAATALLLLGAPALADDPLLNDTVSFTGQIFHLQLDAPGLIIAAVRGEESAVFGYGEIAKGSGIAPDGDTKIRVGSITKSVTGLVLADLVSKGKIGLTKPAGDYIDLSDTFPERDGVPVRVVDLVTHAGGFPRETEPVDGAETWSDEEIEANLANPLLFTPGTGVLYSNLGFNLLGLALAQAAGEDYGDLVRNTVLDPLSMDDTAYGTPDGATFTGYDWDGEVMDLREPVGNGRGASGLFSTANDMVKYLKWNLAKGGEMAEVRHISHSAHLYRDAKSPVYSMDESGEMNAMGLGWVIMMPQGERPLIIQKAGGSSGIFSYIAFAPERGVGVFIAINQFDFAGASSMGHLANELIANLAPR